VPTGDGGFAETPVPPLRGDWTDEARVRRRYSPDPFARGRATGAAPPSRDIESAGAAFAPLVVIRAMTDPQASTFRRSGKSFGLAWDGRVLEVRIAGPTLGQSEVAEVNSAVTEAFDAAGANLRHLVFDMTGVQGMSSMGLGFCIAFRNEAARRGADCLVIGIGEDLLDLFRLTKIDSLFRICRTDADLRKALEG
jgi:anti-anti-sigma factor